MYRYTKDFTNTIRILFLFLGITLGSLGCTALSIKMEPEIARSIKIRVIEDPVLAIDFTNPTALHSFHLPEEEPEPLEGPELYDSYVYEICENYPNVNPETIRALIYVESRYDPTATSSKNCVGLMQLNPKWQTERARSLGVEDLYDPYGNILTGVDLFNDLLTNYADGDEVYAIMMYNMGHVGARKPYQNGIISNFALNVLERRSIQEVYYA